MQEKLERRLMASAESKAHTLSSLPFKRLVMEVASRLARYGLSATPSDGFHTGVGRGSLLTRSRDAAKRTPYRSHN